MRVSAGEYLFREFVQDLSLYAQQSRAWKMRAQDIPSWVIANRMIYGAPWSYEAAGPKIEWGQYDVRTEVLPRPYLLQFIRDMSERKSVIKPRQTELTENHINEALYYAITRPHTRISHVFPTDEMGDAISNEKIIPAITESPRIKEYLSAIAVRRIAFSNGSMYAVTGALKRAGGRAASRDVLIFDEVDSMPESVFGVYEELMSHSALRLVRKLSTPTVPGVGIDRIVSQGCEYEWQVLCTSCKREQTFIFPDNIINFFDTAQYDPEDPRYLKRLAKTYIGCRYCKAYIDRTSRHYLNTSRWVARKPELAQSHASYRCVIAMIPWKTGMEITRRYHELQNYTWQFYNEVWGTAYLKAEQRLTEMELRACEASWGVMQSRMPTMRKVSIGVDWGEKQSWVVVVATGVEMAQPQKKCVVYVEDINETTLRQHGFSGETTDHVKRVRQLIDIFEADICVNDANGLGVDRNALLVRWFPKRAWGCFFDTAEEGRQIRKSKLQIPLWTARQYRVTVSKLNAWKDIQNSFRRGAILIPRYDSAPETMSKFIRHCMAVGIQPRWSSQYEREFEIAVRLSPDDHFAMALIYAMVGSDKLDGFMQVSPAGVIAPTVLR